MQGFLNFAIRRWPRWLSTSKFLARMLCLREPGRVSKHGWLEHLLVFVEVNQQVLEVSVSGKMKYELQVSIGQSSINFSDFPLPCLITSVFVYPFLKGTRLAFDPTPMVSHMTLPPFWGRVECEKVVFLAAKRGSRR